MKPADFCANRPDEWGREAEADPMPDQTAYDYVADDIVGLAKRIGV